MFCSANLIAPSTGFLVRGLKSRKDYLGIENLLENVKRSDTQYQNLKELYNSLTKK
jgi:hypothetical protein